jgi:hypothetical protein
MNVRWSNKTTAATNGTVFLILYNLNPRLETVKRWKFVTVLLTLYLLLQTLDVATTLYGISYMGLVEDNPDAAELMDVKGLKGGMLDMAMNNLSMVLLLVIMSNWRVGPIIAVTILGAYSAQFIPTVLNNAMWIAFGRGLFFEQMMLLYGASYLLGGAATLFYLNRVGDLEELTDYLRRWLGESPLTRGVFDVD